MTLILWYMGNFLSDCDRAKEICTCCCFACELESHACEELDLCFVLLFEGKASIKYVASK